MGVGVSQRKGLRQEFVGAMARRRIVSPCDYYQLVEIETFREFFQSCGDLLGNDDRTIRIYSRRKHCLGDNPGRT